jgi:DNA-directed RNA polymerase specialized sigma24 family protein
MYAEAPPARVPVPVPSHVSEPVQTLYDERGAEPAERVLKKAQAGCLASREELATWVYSEGSRYFRSRIKTEPLLSFAEAQDLAGESLLEFQKALPRIVSLHRYVRRMLRNNLIRHLSRKRARRTREFPGEDMAGGRGYLESASMEFELQHQGWTDLEQLRIQISRRRLEEADVVMKQILTYRLAEEPLGYREIGLILGLEDAALRMRVARFFRSVRDECGRAERRWMFLRKMAAQAGRR